MTSGPIPSPGINAILYILDMPTCLLSLQLKFKPDILSSMPVLERAI
jgi:hypothetical protein